MVALLIFTLAAIVLGASYVNILQAYQVADRVAGEDQDVAFARQELLTQADLATAEKGDAFDTVDGRHVAWSAAITPAATTDLFSVEFTCDITEPSPKPPTKVVQDFMLLRPTWSDPAERAKLRQAAANRIAVLHGTQQP
jgi:general secretion pathway protein I